MSKICSRTKYVCNGKVELWRSITGKQVGVYNLDCSFENEDFPDARYIKFGKFQEHMEEEEMSYTESATSMFQYVPSSLIQAAISARNAPRREEIESDEGNCSNSNSSGSSENISNERNPVHAAESDYESNYDSSQEHIASETEDTHL